ncbi:MAG TPA: LptE family protein [Draconibacterium sp.]|nr:LptE family protein [Draconibacterium sp.]
MLKRFILATVLVVLIGSIAPSCKITYSFTGANLSPEVRTYTVYYFPNRAKLINPTLSQSFTENLRTKIERQTSLNELSENGDIEFEGQITGYEFRPMAVQKDDLSSKTRLTITVKMKFTNHKAPEDDFEQTFSSYEDFESSQPISSVEDDLTSQIIEKLTDDIFNATIANW